MGNNRMKFTGERYIPGVEGFIKSEHIHRYFMSMDFVKNKTVLDIACGEGYGSFMISTQAKNVYGVDVDLDTIQNAQIKYQNDNLKFQIGDIMNLTFENNKFDVIICFETIEHVVDYEKSLSELKRVLKKDGILIMSTPNKYVYSDNRNFKNNFHFHEFYLDEYKSWIQSKFDNNIFLMQNPIFGSYIQNLSDKSIINYTGNFSTFKILGENDFKYIISISSDSNIKDIPSSHFFENNINLFIDSQINKSLSYKVGSFILYPFKMLKKWIKL